MNINSSTTQFDAMFAKFSKHVPRILRKQLLTDTVNQLQRGSASTATPPSPEENEQDLVRNFVDVPIHLDTGPGTDRPPSARPTLERFHGTLLFVDISGFTILSQKLKPEKLQSFINAYFKRLIDIVEKYDGEVIKFAGDALFIIWQTKVNSLDDPEFEARSAEGVRSAIACGMEINSTCSDYRVELHERQSSLHTAIIENIETSAENYCAVVCTDPLLLPADTGNNNENHAMAVAVKASQSQEERVAFLNVHSGLAVGVMAGMDVGFRDRWEFLLLGKPLDEVAAAESEAGKGELVISAEAHKLLHPPSSLPSADGSVNGHTEGCDSTDGFACVALPSGRFKVVNSPKKQHKLARTTSTDELEDEIAHASLVLREIDEELNSCAASVAAFVNSLPAQTVADEQDAAKGDINTSPSMYLALSTEKTLRMLEQSLLDDIMRHVHTSPRADYLFANIPRTLQNCWSSFSAPSTIDEGEGEGEGEVPLQTEQETDSPLSPEKFALTRHSFVKRVRSKVSPHRQSLQQQFKSKASMSFSQGSEMLAELREVIVMFINIDIPAAEIDLALSDSEDASQPEPLFSTCPVESFHFLKRSKSQIVKDNKLLMTVQTCARLMTDAMKRHGGLLRQFIIDDKGSVAIGTWGLRKSMSNDMAAMAMSSARDVVHDLKAVGISAAVGLTSGKVYCGLVGSPSRHEFAVMGPSVNLSARLMGKAGWGEILCDADVRGRDRTHMYLPFAQIAAKGYADPVATFKPVFRELSAAFNSELSTPRNKNDLAVLKAKVLGSSRKESSAGLDLQSLSLQLLQLQHQQNGSSGSLSSNKTHLKSLQASNHLHEVNSKGHILSETENSTPLASALGGKRQRPRRRSIRLLSLTTHNRENLFGRNREIAEILREISLSEEKSENAEELMVHIAMIDSATALFDARSSFFANTPTFRSAVVRRNGHGNAGNNSARGAPSPRVRSENRNITLPRITSNTSANNGLHAPSIDEHHTDDTIDCADPNGSRFFPVSAHSKLIVVSGGSGMGKSALTKHITRSLLRLSLSRPAYWNILVYSNSDRSFLSIEPFSQWKQVFLSLLCDHYAFSTPKQMHTQHAVPSAQEKRRLALKGLALLKPSLPIHVQRRLSLLECVSSLFCCEDEGRSLSGAMRAEATMEVLIAVLKSVRDARECVLLFHLENLHEMDSSSLRLIRRLWNEENGFVFLVTLTTQLSQSLAFSRKNMFTSSPSHDAHVHSVPSDEIQPQAFVEVFPFLASAACVLPSQRLCIIELQNLSETATHALASSILREYSVAEDESTGALLEKILSISGGNPLYTTELANALGQSCAQLFGARGGSGIGSRRAELSRLVESLHVTRIEEVIQFRFDQLSSAAQLLLKIVSAACANGARASLSLLGRVVSLTEFEELRELFADCATAEERMLRVLEVLDEEVLRNDIFLVLSERKRVFTEREELLLRDRESRGGSQRDLLRDEDLSNTPTLLPRVHSLPRIDTGNHHNQHNNANIQRRDLHITQQNVSNLSVHFDIELERASIYNVMLDAQKASLHEKVARFLSEIVPSIERVHLQAHCFEEAFHWEKGGIWHNAMLCYFFSAMLLDEAGQFLDSRRHLLRAYRCFSKMRQESDLPCALDKYADAQTDAQTQLQRSQDNALLVNAMPARFQTHFDVLLFSVNNQQKQDNNNDNGSGANNAILRGSFSISQSGRHSHAHTRKSASKADLFRMYNGDVSLLHSSLSLLFRLAHSCYKLDVDTAVVSQLLEEAMEIISVVQVRAQPNKQPQALTPTTTPTHTQAQTLRAREKERLRCGREEDLCARSSDFFISDASLCLPILLNVLMLYHKQKLADDALRSREASCCTLFLTLARSPAISFAELHLANGLVLQRHLVNAQGKLTEGLECTAQAMACYCFENHHTASIAHYGTDYVPQGIAQSLQTAIVLGESAKGEIENYLRLLSPLPVRITHLQTLATLSIPLSLALHTMGETRCALLLFKHYLLVENEQANVFSHFRHFNQLLWLSLLLDSQQKHPLMCTQNGATSSSSIALSESSAHDLSELQASLVNAHAHMSLDEHSVHEETHSLLSLFLAKILDRQFLTYPQSARRFAFLALSFYGFPPEYACAMVLLSLCREKSLDDVVYTHTTEEQERSVTVRECLSLAEEYLSYTLPCVAEDKSFIFAHCLVVLAQAEVLLLRLQRVTELSQDERSESWLALQNVLGLLKDKAETFQLSFVSQKLVMLEERANSLPQI